jgi:lysozyme
MLKTLRAFVFAAIVSPILVLSISFSTPASALTPCASWLNVVDFSSNNAHPIDWAKLAKANIAGVYVKNSEAADYVNPFWAQDIANAQKVGIPYGGYYFAQPGKVDPVVSAKYFVANKGYLGQLPPALDLEVTKLSPEATARWALLWLQTVQQLSGRKPIIYVGYYFPASQYPFLAPYDLWLPAYPNGYKPAGNVCLLPLPKVPNPWRTTGWQMWQFTSIAHPNGTRSKTDLSVAVASWFAKWTGAGMQPSTNPNKPAAPLYSTGSHGTKVLEIQRLLISKGLLPKGSDDGIFGIITKRALEKWQVTIGIKGDGMWSADTQKASDFYLKNGYTLAQQARWQAVAAIMKASGNLGGIK